MTALERGAPKRDHEAVARHLRAVVDLGRLGCTLDAAGVRFLVFKGPALLATVYPPGTIRSYVDLDVLVRPADVGRAVAALEADGFRLLDANWPLLMKAPVGELRLLSEAGGPIDLHWHACSPASEIPGPSAARLLQRAVPFEIRGRSYSTFCPADTVVHLAVHAATSGGHRRQWLLDLDAALRYAEERCVPGQLRASVDDWEASLPVDLMLGRAHRALGTTRPEELAGLVQTSSWKIVAALTERVSGTVEADDKGSLSKLVARSCRPDERRSIRAFGSKSWKWLVGRGSPRLGPDVLLDAANPISALHPVGGREAAEEFFAKVASGYPTSSTKPAAPDAGSS